MQASSALRSRLFQAARWRTPAKRVMTAPTGIHRAMVWTVSPSDPHLEHHHRVRVSAATVSRSLTRHGLVIAEPKKRPNSSYIRFAAEPPRSAPHRRLWRPGLHPDRQRDGVHHPVLRRPRRPQRPGKRTAPAGRAAEERPPEPPPDPGAKQTG